jgi:tRNA modification GTPase
MILKVGDEDTICALSTPPGVGGIAVIRVSGEGSLAITRQLCSFLPDAPESHRVFYGLLRGLDYQGNHEVIDEVVVTYFAKGRSFTGEQTLEISCHGGQVTTTSILKELVKAGCRMARRGEFTYRAFMNGRLDLVQAESVLSLIESQSRQAAKVSLRQLQGHLSADFQTIENELLWVLAHLEASIDFSTEGLETVGTSELSQRSESLNLHVQKLISSYGKGRLMTDGLQVALVGRPNAGKSSLLNALLKEDRAIVTEHAGTTRDLIEGRLSYSGVPVTFVDTAGLRETDNEIEKIGIQRSRSAMEKADFVFFVIDVTQLDWLEDIQSFHSQSRSQPVFILNKMDLPLARDVGSEALRILSDLGHGDRSFQVSANTGFGLERIEEMVARHVAMLDSEASNVVTQARHLELLTKIHSCLSRAVGLMRADSSPEFIAFELQESVRAIHELLGKQFDEQVIDRIFKEFCLGK